MGKLRDRLIKGTALNFVAVAFNQGSTLLASVLLARILQKIVYGEYAMVQSTLLTVVTLSQLATGAAASKHVAEYRCRDPLKAGRIMGLCAIVCAVTAALSTLVLIFCSPWIAGTMLKAPHLTFALTLGSGFLFFSTLNGYQLGALSGLEAYGSLAKAGAVSGLLAVISTAAGAWAGGVYGGLAGLSLSSFIRCAIHQQFLRAECRVHGVIPTYRGSIAREKSILSKFILPAAIAQCYSPPMIWLATSLLARQPGGFGEIAFYSVAGNFRALVLFMPGVMNSVGLSILNQQKAEGNVDHYHQIFKSNVAFIGLASFVGAIVIAIAGRPLLHLFGKDFGSAQSMLLVLLASGVFDAMSIALYQYILAQSKIWHQFLGIVVPRDAFFVIAAYYLVPSHLGLGLAIAYLIASFLGVLLHLALVARFYHEEQHEAIALAVRSQT